MVSASATPGSRKGTHTSSQTALVATQPRLTTFFIARVSRVQSATWKSSLMKNASNNTTWKCVTFSLTPLCEKSSHPASEPGSPGPSYYKPVPVGLQGKNNDCCRCSCHRFWCRCWYSKLRWVSLVKAEGPLLGAATDVCGLSKYHKWKPDTWWWNEEVDKAIWEKRARFKVCSALKKGGITAEAKKGKTAYIDAKHVAKNTVWLVKSEAKKEEFATISPRCFPYCQTDGSHKAEQHWWELCTQRCWRCKMKCSKAIGHHSWDAESCWWGSSWVGETTDRGYFQLQCDPIRLGREIDSELL